MPDVPSAPADSRVPLYIFLDEGGDLNFSATGSKYFTLTSVACVRPFPVDGDLTSLRFDLIEEGTELECFHACEDRQAVRDRVFGLIATRCKDLRVDSVVVEKRKTGPALQEHDQFYPRMMGYLLKYVYNAIEPSAVSEVIVITDAIPIASKRKVISKAVKETLAKMLPSTIKHRIMHHQSKSCSGLQVADYFNWAVFRKWERSDPRSLLIVRSSVRSQFDIFRNGIRHYY